MAYAHLKEWIIQLHLKPGSRLSIQDMAEALGISRTPVREALNRLEQEHLVVHAPMKGFCVKAMDLGEIADLFEVRTAIEILAAGQAARRINPESRQQLADSLASTFKWMREGEKHRSLKLEQSFHMKILEATGNISLVEIGKGILERIWAIQNFNLITSDMLVQAHQEHTLIFEALSANDPKRAERMMRSHMKHTTSGLMARLKDHNDIIHSTVAFDPGKWKGIKR